MKHIKLSLCLLLFLSTSAIAQNYTWTPQNSNTSNNLAELFFVDTYRGYAAGAAGAFCRTYDGGNSWSYLNGPSSIVTVGLHFDDQFNGFLVDNLSRVYKTTDGGTTWTPKYTNNEIANCMLKANGKLMVGRNSQILFSTNGGDSWDSISCPVSGSITEISFTADGQTGYASSYTGNVAITTNGGASWSPVSGSTGASFLSGIHTISANKVIAIGDAGLILSSIDGGVTWVPVTTGISFDLSGIDFYNSLYGIIVGANDAILETVNGGLSWTSTPTGSGSNFQAVQCQNTIIAYIAGTNGAIYRSPDGVEDIVPLEYTGPDTVCVGTPFDFSFLFSNIGVGPAFNPGFTVVAGGGPLFNDTLTWVGNLNGGDSTSLTEPGAVFNSAGVYSVLLFSTEQYNQTNNLLVFTIVAVDPQPTDVTASTYFCPDDTVYLEAAGGNSYYWPSLVGVVSDPSNPFQEVYPTQSVTHYVEITQQYCVVDESIQLILESNCGSIDSMNVNPSQSYAFSPNNDGVNDFLIFDFLDSATTNVVTIFNRWGDEVYSVSNYDNNVNAWDGTFLNRLSPAGTYFFIIESEEHGERKGWVQLVR